MPNLKVRLREVSSESGHFYSTENNENPTSLQIIFSVQSPEYKMTALNNKNIDRAADTYSESEERINIISHAAGILFSVAALFMLVKKAMTYGDIWHIISFPVFGITLILLYTASTLYHFAKDAEKRRRLKIVDHAAIYLLIAGTYTPYTLVTIHGTTGWIIFGISWGSAFTGIVLKIFFTGRYKTVSTVLYIAMGWIIIFALKPLLANLPLPGFIWMIAGGVSYTVGAIFYSIRKIKFNHAIFHFFVLGGSILQFISVIIYV